MLAAPPYGRTTNSSLFLFSFYMLGLYLLTSGLVNETLYRDTPIYLIATPIAFLLAAAAVVIYARMPDNRLKRATMFSAIVLISAVTYYGQWWHARDVQLAHITQGIITVIVLLVVLVIPMLFESRRVQDRPEIVQ